jgi:hypothetical protein
MIEFRTSPIDRRDFCGITATLLLPSLWKQDTPLIARGSPRLFDGKTLDGWSGDPKFWTVQDGCITGRTTTQNPTKGNTFLLWQGGLVEDFELHAMVRIDGGNSGIQYRSRHLGDWVVAGYQADFEAGDTYSGILYEERGRGILAKQGEKVEIGTDGKPVVVGKTADPAEAKSAFKKGAWNRYVIRAEGNRLQHTVNGILTVDVTDNDTERRAMRGILALQLHAGPPMSVQFKELRLRTLTRKQEQ